MTHFDGSRVRLSNHIGLGFGERMTPDGPEITINDMVKGLKLDIYTLKETISEGNSYYCGICNKKDSNIFQSLTHETIHGVLDLLISEDVSCQYQSFQDRARHHISHYTL